jgi:hypothetical protein
VLVFSEEARTTLAEFAGVNVLVFDPKKKELLVQAKIVKNSTNILLHSADAPDHWTPNLKSMGYRIDSVSPQCFCSYIMSVFNNFDCMDCDNDKGLMYRPTLRRDSLRANMCT